MEGPADPAERVEAIRARIRAPRAVRAGLRPLPDRARATTARRVVEGIRAIAEAGRAHGVRVALEPVQREFAHFWTIVSSLDEAAALIDEAGADVGLIYDSWQLYGEPLEEIERHRDRIRGVHLADWRDPTRNTNDRVLPGDGVVDFGADPRGAALGRALRPGDLLRPGAARLALEGGPARARGARDRGAAEDAIERVCVVGGGVIGSLFAGHLARVCEVSRPLPPRGARAGAERARPARLRPARVRRPRCERRPTRASSRSPSSRSSPRRRPSSRPPPRASRATGRARR